MTNDTSTPQAAILSAEDMLLMPPEAIISHMQSRYEYGERIEYFTITDIGWLLDHIRAQSAALQARDTTIAELVGVLRWYADEVNYVEDAIPPGFFDLAASDVQYDLGARARSALAAIEQETP